MGKSKIARKVADIKYPSTSNRIKLVNWLSEAYPEVYEQYCAIKDLEESVEIDQFDPMLKSLVESWAQLNEENAE